MIQCLPSGGAAQAVGGPFDKDGAVGKQFTKDGAIGGVPPGFCIAIVYINSLQAFTGWKASVAHANLGK